MFSPMCLYRFKVRNVLKTIAIEKQANLLFRHRTIRCKVNRLIRAVIKQSLRRRRSENCTKHYVTQRQVLKKIVNRNGLTTQ